MALSDRLKKWRKRREERRERLGDLRDELKGVLAKIERVQKKREGVRKGSEEAKELHEEIADLRERRHFLDERILEVESKLEAAIVAVRRLRRRIKRKRSASYMSAHFHVREFACRDGTAVPKAAYPALRAWCQEYGEPLRAKYGTVSVNSGYRTAPYNASIGGASDSVHIYSAHPNAVAVDFHCASGRPSDWATFLESRADGLGRYSTFVHADNRNRIGWSNARWSG